MKCAIVATERIADRGIGIGDQNGTHRQTDGLEIRSLSKQAAQRDKIAACGTAVSFRFSGGQNAFLGEYFPAAIALTACLASRNPIYIYLAIGGSRDLCYIRTGVDAWSELIAVIGCALLFAGVKKIHLDLWHRALIAGSVGILSLSIYRLATATVNKTGAGELLADGIMIAGFLFLWEGFFRASKEEQGGLLSLAGLTVAWILAVCGTGAGFLLWPAAIF